jgi:hypothetical protein
MRGPVAVIRRTVVSSTGLALAASLILTPVGGAWASDTTPSPIAANQTTKARNIPAYPTDSRLRGKRIVYDKALMTIWLISEGDQVVVRYPVVGRPDRPSSGVYRVFSKSPSSANRLQELTFKNMVRFARGPSTGAPIGFHDIPRTYDGRPIHGENVLGLPIGTGGCVRMSTDASEQVYEFAGIGTAVEVIASTAS